MLGSAQLPKLTNRFAALPDFDAVYAEALRTVRAVEAASKR